MNDFEILILNKIAYLKNPVLDIIMVFFTYLSEYGILWIVIGLALCFVKKYRVVGITVLTALILNLIISNFILNPIVARIRPYDYANYVDLIISKQSNYSFPSGHSSASFAASFSVFKFKKNVGIALMIVSAITAFSRLYLYMHYPTDVIAGAIIGILSSLVSYKLCTKLFKKVI